MQERSKYVLEMVDVEKSFPGVKALDRARLCVREGSIHALMGENGAGKSTLMKCLFGIYRKDSGSIRICGEEVDFQGPLDALRGGVAMVHQELNQALKRSVADNLFLGRYPKRFGLVDEGEIRRKTKALLTEVGLKIDPAMPIGRLSVAERQMVEIAKAISYGAKILVLDEPTSSLTDPEVEHLFQILKKLKATGCGIIYISHKMAEILTISDEVTVMRDGRHVSTDPTHALTMEEIIHRMVGRSLTDMYPKREPVVGGELLSVRGLCARSAGLKDISFHLNKGEILGIAGLVGAGRTELLETLFALRQKTGGEVLLEGEEISPKNTKEAISHGFALLTEERRANGIFAGLSIRDNTCISSLGDYKTPWCLLSDRRQNQSAGESVKNLRVKTPSLFTPIRNLSGGNQQKVILGRWLLTRPRVLMLDEPTRGIDVGAKAEIYQLLLSLKLCGKGILVVSSELPELLGICDRILVMSGGRLAGEVAGDTATQEEIMALAARYV